MNPYEQADTAAAATTAATRYLTIGQFASLFFSAIAMVIGTVYLELTQNPNGLSNSRFGR